jgi:hypothetical protein
MDIHPFIVVLFSVLGFFPWMAWAIGQPRYADLVDYSLSRDYIQTKRVVVTDRDIHKLMDTSLLKLDGVGLNFIPIDGNCYCEYPNSDEFLHLNLLYDGDGYIEYMNQFMKEIKGHPLPPISVQLFMDNNTAPAGYNSGTRNIRLWFGEANFDPSFVIHEISHQIHSELMGKTQDELYDSVGKYLDRRSYFEFLGVIEGVANFLTALYLDDPIIGKIAWMDIPYSIDNRVVYESMPSEFDFNNRMVQSTLFAQRYPILVTRVRAGLANLKDAQQPNPYLSSQIIFQPLWAYRTQYSRPEYFRLLLKFLELHPKFTSYSDFANQLVEYIDPRDHAFGQYLRAEYIARHLPL